LVRVERLEVFLRDISLIEAFLNIVLLKHCVPD